MRPPSAFRQSADDEQHRPSTSATIALLPIDDKYCCYELPDYPRSRSDKSPAPNAGSMRSALCVRNTFYGLLLFLTVTVLRTYTPSDLAGGHERVDTDHRKTDYAHPRLKRMILKAPSISDDSLPMADDVFISVKTTGNFHATRLRTILDTWFTLAPDKVYFFTDTDDASISEETGGHFINTGCAATHQRQALNCKMSAEIDRYLASTQSWFCHFDDDNYVNVPELQRLLSYYNPKRDWYLGRPSTRGPITIETASGGEGPVSFWFATGGAGFCLSRSLVTKMAPYVSNGGLVSLGDSIRLPDDVTIGYLIEHLLNVRLTVVSKFHSHLESMKLQRRETLGEQVSLSYGSYNPKDTPNTVRLDDDQRFPTRSDPSRFRALHCLLFPAAQLCRTTLQ